MILTKILRYELVLFNLSFNNYYHFEIFEKIFSDIIDYKT